MLLCIDVLVWIRSGVVREMSLEKLEVEGRKQLSWEKVPGSIKAT